MIEQIYKVDYAKIIRLLFIFLLLGFLSFVSTPGSKTFAFDCSSTNNATSYRFNGLLTAPNTPPLSFTGQQLPNGSPTPCVADSNEQYTPLDLGQGFYSYDSLFNQFYTKASQSGIDFEWNSPTTDPSFASDPTYRINVQDNIFYLLGSLNIDHPFPGNPVPPPPTMSPDTKVGVFFVKGDLNVYQDIPYLYGLVFVVKGSVYIYPGVKLINAVIITDNDICTNWDSVTSSCKSTGSPDNQLVVKGSLISLKQDTPGGNKHIKFVRDLGANNASPAEQINFDPKYLVILRKMFSQTFTVTSEDTSYGTGN